MQLKGIIWTLFFIGVLFSCVTIDLDTEETLRKKSNIKVESHWNVSNNKDYLNIWGLLENLNTATVKEVVLRIQITKNDGKAIIDFIKVRSLYSQQLEEFSETFWIGGDVVTDVQISIKEINF